MFLVTRRLLTIAPSVDANYRGERFNNMSDHLEKLYEKFLQCPSSNHFLNLTEKIVIEKNHLRKSDDWRALQQKYRLSQHAGLIRDATCFIPAWLLSPRFHQMLADSASQLGDEELVKLENFQLQQCLAGLEDTGDGSAANPYLVAHTSDMHDILAAHNLRRLAQHHVQHTDFSGDLITCDDGTELWFRPVLQWTAPYQGIIFERDLSQIQ